MIHIIIKIDFLILIVSIFFGCIETYMPENTNSVKSVVVDALITDEKEEQVVILSQSTNLVSPIWEPISRANMVIVDKGNNIFEFNESPQTKGVYEGVISREFLIPGNAFKLSFITQNGKTYESNFEELLECPTVDSIYYEINNNYFPKNTNSQERGIQFYLSVISGKSKSKYYKWELEETYEYHATWPIQKYWYGRWQNKGSNYDYFVCYRTLPILSIFSANTTHHIDSAVIKYPLHFVNNQTQRLYFRYSLLVKQLSITAGAYQFWEGLKSNNLNSGGLYDKQPVTIKSNLVCLSNPNEKVYGYFGVSSIQTKRISINNFAGLIYDFDVFCKARLIHEKSLSFIEDSPPDEWPIYVAPIPPGEPLGIYYAEQGCFDCRKIGGSIEVPEFWKNK